LRARSSGVSASVRMNAMDLPSGDHLKARIPPGMLVSGSASPPLRAIDHNCIAGLAAAVSSFGALGSGFGNVASLRSLPGAREKWNGDPEFSARGLARSER